MKSAKTADIAMDYSALETLVSEINSINADFREMCKELDSLACSLDGIWQGQAKTEFATSYNQLRPKLDSISSVLNKYSDEITNAANNEMNLEAQSRIAINHIILPSF